MKDLRETDWTSGKQNWVKNRKNIDVQLFSTWRWPAVKNTIRKPFCLSLSFEQASRLRVGGKESTHEMKWCRPGTALIFFVGSWSHLGTGKNCVDIKHDMHIPHICAPSRISGITRTGIKKRKKKSHLARICILFFIYLCFSNFSSHFSTRVVNSLLDCCKLANTSIKYVCFYIFA